MSQNVDANRKVRRRLLETETFRYAAGLKISETGTRNIATSA